MANLPYKTRKLIWIGDSKELLSSFPIDVKKVFGFALRLVQNGITPEIAKPLTGFDIGVYELKTNSTGNTYRTVYVVKLKKAVYVIDAFIKKSTKGNKTPKQVRERLNERIQCACELDKE